MIKIKLHKKLLATTETIDLHIETHIDKGEFIAFFGPSGAGKTSFLKMLAGLLKPDKGYIKVANEVWYDSQKKIFLPPQKRSIGMVFQDYALFPNMSVKENLCFAQKENNKDFIEHLLEITDLKNLEKRYPKNLSGGQQQRVALARALVQNPKLLLLDEPLSALDSHTRLKLQGEIARLHSEFATTTILVSHDLGEIFKLAHRVLVIENGKIAKQGTAEEVFINDKISGKFRFIGEVVEIIKVDVVYIVTVLIGNNAVRVVASEKDVQNIAIGEKVVIFSKAFNPIILKAKPR